MSKATVVSFALGAVIGSGATYLYLKKKYDDLLTFTYSEEDDVEEGWDEEIAQEFDNGVSLVNPTPEIQISEGALKFDNGIVVNPTPEIQISEGARKQSDYRDYTKFATKDILPEEPEADLHPVDSDEDEAMETPEEELEDLRGDNASKQRETDRTKKPEIIPEDQYGILQQFDTEVLMYYIEDAELATEDFEQVDEEELLGTCLSALSWKDECYDRDEIFIRNWELMTDYKVIAVDGSYSAY